MFVTSPMWSFSPGRGCVSAHERKLTKRTGGEVTTSSAEGKLESCQKEERSFQKERVERHTEGIERLEELKHRAKGRTRKDEEVVRGQTS